MKTKNAVDFNQYISQQVSAFKFYNLWFYIPHPRYSYEFWWEVLKKIIVLFSCFFLPTFGQAVYLLKSLFHGHADIQVIAGTSNLIFGELIASLRLLFLFIRRDALIELIDHLVSDEFQQYTKCYEKIFLRTIKLSKIFFVGFTACALSDVTLHMVIVPALHRFETLPLNMDFIFVDGRVLKRDENYFYVFAYQVLYKLVFVPIYLTLQTIFWSFMLCAISQLDVLICNIENMKSLVAAARNEMNYDESEAFRHVLLQYISHHRHIIGFVKKIEKTFSEYMFVSLCLTACVVCTCAVQILCIGSPIKNSLAVFWVLVYLSLLASMFFMDCYFANTITQKSLHLSTVTFAGPWLRMPTKLKKDLIMFLARTQQPLQITALGIVPISLETFKMIAAKCSWKHSLIQSSQMQGILNQNPAVEIPKF